MLMTVYCSYRRISAVVTMVQPKDVENELPSVNLIQNSQLEEAHFTHKINEKTEY